MSSETTPEPIDADRLAADFSSATRADWEALVRAKQHDPDRPLTTTLEDGIEVSWLYTADDELASDPGGLAGRAPFVRGQRDGTPWAIRQRTRTPDRATANAEILDDLVGGATEILLRTATGDRSGIEVSTADELAEVLDGVHLQMAPVALDAGADGLATAELLCEVWRRSGHPPTAIRGALRLDPIGAGASDGAGDDALDAVDAAIEALARTSAEFPRVTVLAADTTRWVQAGAGAVLELALAVATALAYLRAGNARDVEPDAVAARLEFTLVAGPDQFLEIAKLRAARRLWATVLRHCGVRAEQRRSPTYVATSLRMTSSLDPPINLLRATTAAFAAAVAGADGITVLPYDEPLVGEAGTPGALGRRMARNTQLVLAEEASLHRVADPAGGSWYVESLTDELARGAWRELQAIERTGGIQAALRGGEIDARIAEATTRRHDEIARRRRLLTGVNVFPLLGDEAAEPTRAVAAGRDDAQFVELRARAHAIADAGAAEPALLLACTGRLAAHVTVAQWAKSFFEAGGVTTVESGVQPDAAAHAALLVEHGLTVAAVCPGAEETTESEAELVAALRAAGARRVYLVGAGDDAADEIGADAGVRDGVDMVAVLDALLDHFDAAPAA